MTIELEPLIDIVRMELAGCPFDMSDDTSIYAALKDSYEFIQMIVDETVTPEAHVRRCLIRLAKYETYRAYTMFAEIKEASMPESSGLQLSTLLMNAYNCLTMIAKVPLNEDLSLKESAYPLPIGAGLTNSSAMTSTLNQYNDNGTNAYVQSNNNY